MAVVGGISFEIEGFDQVLRHIEGLKDNVKRNELLKIFRRQAEPYKRVMIAQAPKAKRTVKYHRNNSIEYKPGNLKRAMKKFTGRSKDYPTIFVGAQAKKPEGSGYYSWFVQHGTQRADGRSIRRKNDYVKRTDELVTDIIGDKASGEVAKYIKRKAAKMGFITV